MARRLIREEGLFCGGSSGSNVHIAVQIAREIGPGKTVVTVLPDAGTRYITKYLADSWMRDYGFLGSDRDLGLVEEIVGAMPPHPIHTARESTTVGEIISTLKAKGISQVPIVDGQGQAVGMVHEVDVLRGLQNGEVTGDSPAMKVMHPIGGLIYPKARIEELFRIFETDQVGVVVDGGKIVGIVSKIDVLEYMAKRGKR